MKYVCTKGIQRTKRYLRSLRNFEAMINHNLRLWIHLWAEIYEHMT